MYNSEGKGMVGMRNVKDMWEQHGVRKSEEFVTSWLWLDCLILTVVFEGLVTRPQKDHDLTRP